ncbi:MAG TPA: DUF167 family protein [Verrucomicrobiae bacterium]
MSLSWFREADGGIYLNIKVQPRASRNQIQGVHGNELKVSVTAPPVDSAANAALLEFLAEQLEVSKSAVRLVRGNTLRHKTIFVAGTRADSVEELLAV